MEGGPAVRSVAAGDKPSDVAAGDMPAGHLMWFHDRTVVAERAVSSLAVGCGLWAMRLISLQAGLNTFPYLARQFQMKKA